MYKNLCRPGYAFKYMFPNSSYLGHTISIKNILVFKKTLRFLYRKWLNSNIKKNQVLILQNKSNRLRNLECVHLGP